jgi:Tol biopolymer transport system component
VILVIHGSPIPEHRSHVGGGLALLVGLAVTLVSALFVGGARTANQAPGLIAFARADGIYVMRADGTGARRIMQTTEPRDIYGRAIAWSPDGTKLVIATWTGIWLTDANGRNRVRVATGGQPYGIGEKPYRKLFYPRATNFGSPTWSPDSRSIAFTAFQGVENRDIWVMNADGSGQHRLKKTPFWEGKVDWSAVGGWLVFDSGSYVSDVYVMKTNGTGLRLLTRGGGWVGSGQPAWSPDGQKVVFARPSGIWVMNANGGAQMQLTHHALDEYPAWSSSGRIAFVRKLVWKKVMLPAARDASSEIYVMNADGTGVTRLTHNRVGEASPAWQPVAPS